MKAESILKKTISNNNEWCNEPRNNDRSRLDKSIKKALSSREPTACAVASVDFSGYANWHAAHGTNAILKGDEEGWKDIQLSLEYLWLRMQAASPDAYVVKNALVLAHFMLMDDMDRAGMAADIQITSIEKAIPPRTLWEDNKFGVFALEAWSILSQDERAHKAVAASPFDAGIYQDVLNHGLDSPEKVDAMLDYHLQQAWTQKGYPAFVYHFYNLFPIDYLLTKKLHPDCADSSHPLLSLPLAVIPKVYDLHSLDLHPEYERFVSRLSEIKNEKSGT